MYSLPASRSALRNIVGAARATRVTARFSSTMHDNDPETLETEKARNLSGTQYKTSTPHKHAPGWNEHLATASEASVKADKDAGDPIELQKMTVEYIQSRHSPDEAYYPKDQVDGPLSSATSEGDSDPQVLVRETIEKKTEFSVKDGKADRGVLSTE
ncbi:hypothetical protein DFH06DRAFT_1165138 [Mycena polygramma]|nr:hypothetical protein DFH06DRAFT_1165138 [Mycena polygramma]